MRNSVSDFFWVLFFAPIFSVGSFLFAEPLFAQTSRLEELRQSITEREDDIKKLEAEIADYKNRLYSVGNQKRTLQTTLQALDLSRAKLAKDIQLTEKKIAHTSAIIGDLDKDITSKTHSIDRNKALIAEIIHRINRADSDTMIEVLLSNSSISDFLEEVEDLAKMQRSIQEHTKTLDRLKDELASTRKTHQKEFRVLSGLKDDLADQKTLADQDRKQQTYLLTTTKNQEANYKKLLSEREARKKQFEAEVDDFEAQLRAEIDPTSFPSPGTKVLRSPLDDLKITQKFGQTVDARRLYRSGTHNGTDFRASPGSKVYASGRGTVTATGDTDKVCPGASYGRWVLIKHPNGLSTLYAHLELIKVRTGAEIEAGDVLGYSGNTGYSTGPHLHFTVYVSSAVEVIDFPSKSCKGAVFKIPVAPANAYLDPEDYL